MTAAQSGHLPPGPPRPGQLPVPAAPPGPVAGSRTAVVVLVAAAGEQPGPPPPAVDNRPRWLAATAEPVGTQHAVARRVGGVPGPLALCGADLAGWIVFADRRFDLSGTANCQRCAQLVSARTRPSRTGG